MTPDPDRLLWMGRIGRPHGVRGDLKVYPETDDPQRFTRIGRVFVGPTPEAATEREVRAVRFQYPKGRVTVLLSLVGADSREAAEALGGDNVYALEDDLPPLEAGEVYVHQMIGLAVLDTDAAGAPMGAPIGTVRDVLDGAQRLLVIAREGLPDVLLPDVPAFVRAVDFDAGHVLVRPPEGLFD